MITLIKLGKNGLIFNSSCLIGDLMIPGLMTWTYSMDFNIISYKKYFLEHTLHFFLLKTLDCHPTKAESSSLPLNVCMYYYRPSWSTYVTDRRRHDPPKEQTET